MASIILGGASLLNPRSASIMDDLAPTPNQGSPNPGTFAGATDGEMIGQPPHTDINPMGINSGNAPSEGFHYTDSRWINSMQENGLYAGSYLTPNGNLSPMQASIDLALPPNRDMPNAIIRVDLDAMRRDGYTVPEPRRVSNTVTGSDGRVYTRPGGGYEMQFDYEIPAKYISLVEGD